MPLRRNDSDLSFLNDTLRSAHQSSTPIVDGTKMIELIAISMVSVYLAALIGAIATIQNATYQVHRYMAM